MTPRYSPPGATALLDWIADEAVSPGGLGRAGSLADAVDLACCSQEALLVAQGLLALISSLVEGHLSAREAGA